MATDATGITILARILEIVARGEPVRASDLARELGTARATTFEVVRQLDRSGFVERGASGRITPGPACAALGFAAFALGGLDRAAEALLPVLRDDTHATVDLVVLHGSSETRLMRRGAPEDADARSGGMILEERIETSADAADVRLRLTLRPRSDRDERVAAQACLRAVAVALSRAAAQSPVRRRKGTL